MIERLLIISNNPLSEKYNNGKTIQSIIRRWNTKDIAQLCFKDEEICFDTCHNFYCFTDVEALKSITNSFYKGRIINNKQKKNVTDIPVKKSIVSIFNRSISKIYQWDIIKLVRELLWEFSRWENSQLIEWLDSFKPQVILFVGGDTLFTYKITNYIMQRYSTRLILYLTDDYLTPRFSISPSYWIRYKLLKRSFEKILSKVDRLATIGTAMGNEYKQRFGINSTTFMNALSIPDKKKYIANKPLKLIYAGGIHLNRWKTLAAVGKVLEEINKNGIVAKLEIYTGSQMTKKIEKKLNIVGTSKVMGYVTKLKLEKILSTSDVLIHVEAFDSKSIHATRLSISTKIPEYMMQQRCILGIGPEEVASLEYIKEFAIVINGTDHSTLEIGLQKVISDEGLRVELAKKAFTIAIKNHNIDLINSKFNNMIMDLED